MCSCPVGMEWKGREMWNGKWRRKGQKCPVIATPALLDLSLSSKKRTQLTEMLLNSIIFDRGEFPTKHKKLGYAGKPRGSKWQQARAENAFRPHSEHWALGIGLGVK